MKDDDVNARDENAGDENEDAADGHGGGQIEVLEGRVRGFQEDQQEEVDAAINAYVRALGEVREHEAEAAGVEVPVQLVQRLDQGENPDRYVTGVFEEAMAQNQLAKGKTEALREFRALLGEALGGAGGGGQGAAGPGSGGAAA